MMKEDDEDLLDNGSSADKYDSPKQPPPTSSLNTNSQYDKEILSGRPRSVDTDPASEGSPPFLKVLAGFAAIGGFLFGYDTGVVSGALILLKVQFELPTVWQELFVTITIVAAALSSSVGGMMNDRLGRRPVIQISSLVFLIGAVILSLSYNITMLIIGRAVVGIGVGLASVTVTVYIAELSPPSVRGRFLIINALFITGGQFVAALIDGLFSYWPWGWRYMLGLAGVPALIQMIGFLFLPESPRWLIKHGKLDEACAVLRKTCPPSLYQDQYNQLVALKEQEESSELKDGGCFSTIARIMRTPAVRRALILGCGLQMFQQLAGINTIMYYSASILRMSGVRSDKVVIWLAAVVAFVNFAFTLVGVYFIDRLGRRKLGLRSMAGVLFSQIFLAGAFWAIAFTSPKDLNIYNGTVSDSCSSYSTCGSCIVNSSCGFCYDSYGNSSIANSYCLPNSNGHLTNGSAFGPCSQSNLPEDNFTWAEDYCPSPLSLLALVGLIMYLIFFAPGMGPLPWTINAEIYPLWARSTGNAITGTVNWLCNIMVSMTFLSLTQLITRPGTFALYAVICFFGLVFMYLCLPETKGKPLEQVTALFRVPLFSVGRSSNKTGDYQVLVQEEEE